MPPRCLATESDTSSFHATEDKDDYEWQGYSHASENEPEESLDYERLMAQSIQCKATMHGILDQVYKMQIQAAVALDTFAMMYPTRNLRSGNDDDDSDSENDKSQDSAEDAVEAESASQENQRDKDEDAMSSY